MLFLPDMYLLWLVPIRTGKVHPSGAAWVLCVVHPSSRQNILQSSFPLRDIITTGNLLALLGMQDSLHTKIQTPSPLTALNPCARNPWKTAQERGLTAWVLTFLVAVSSKVPWDKHVAITHSKMVWVFGVSGRR